MEELRSFVRDLRRDLDDAEPYVKNATKHAEDLKKIADELRAVLDDVEHFAKTALEAARVYGLIVDSIYEALAAARLANDTAHNANKKVWLFCMFLSLSS